MPTFAQQFNQYTDTLAQYRPFWQVLPFACTALPWHGTPVQQLLEKLPETELLALEQDPSARQQLFDELVPAAISPAGIVERATPRTLWIGVWSQNLGAQRFYARHGFEKVGEHTFPVGRVVDLEFTLRREKAATPA